MEGIVMQPALFQTSPTFDGDTYDPKKDGPRMSRHLRLVRIFMADQQWHSLAEIAEAVHCTEASASARLRDLRKPKFGGYTVERQRLKDGSGLFFYRLVMPR